MIALLREAYPAAEIGFVVKKAYGDLVAHNRDLTRVHLLEGSSLGDLLSLARSIRAQRYDAVIDLHRNVRSAAIARRSGAGIVSAYEKRERAVAVRVRFARGSFRASRRLVDRYLGALAPLGVVPEYRRPRFHLGADDRAAAGDLLAGAGLAGAPYAAVVPGSVWATKRWPAERYAVLTRRLAEETGLSVLLLGSAGERTLCEAVRAGFPDAVVAAGTTSLGVMAALISLSRLYVGNDSGPTHVAMALDVPTVAIFGPTDPGQFDFRDHALVYADLPCSACSFYGGERCRLRHWDCMETIAADDVLTAAVGLLESRGGSP